MNIISICDDLFGLILDYLELENINIFLDSSSQLNYYKNIFYSIILDSNESEK